MRAGTAPDETRQDIAQKHRRAKHPSRHGEIRAMLAFQLIGAAFLVLCLAALLTRDPSARRPAR